MNKMRPLILIYLLVAFCPLFSKGQENDSLCRALHEGVFYYYSIEANSHSMFIREGKIQKEINMESGDTATFQINWMDDCHYKLTYLTGQGPLAAVARAFGNKLIIDISVLQVTEDYYVFQSASNKITHAPSMVDTLWRSEQPEKLLNRNIIEASFPGGNEAWMEYFQANMKEHERGLGRSRKSGVCLVQFIVDTDGSVTNVKALTMNNSRIARYAVDVIKKGPKWIPGSVNGIPQKMRKVQPITFELTE